MDSIRVKCDNCSHELDLSDSDEELGLHRVSDLYQRITPGAEVPACECPACNCLMYPMGAMSIADVARELIDAVASIRDHGSEFGAVEDFETQCARMAEKARNVISKLAGDGSTLAARYIQTPLKAA